MAIVIGSRRRPGPITRWCAVAVVAGLYTGACQLPAIYLDNGVSQGDLDFKLGSPPGFVLLLIGWCDYVTVFPWLANVCLLVGAVSLLAGHTLRALRWSKLAALLGLSSWFFVWPFSSYRLLGGYYLWQCSLLVLAGAAWWVKCAERETNDTTTVAADDLHEKFRA